MRTLADAILDSAAESYAAELEFEADLDKEVAVEDQTTRKALVDKHGQRLVKGFIKRQELKARLERVGSPQALRFARVCHLMKDSQLAEIDKLLKQAGF